MKPDALTSRKPGPKSRRAPRRGVARRQGANYFPGNGDTQAPRQTGSHVQALCNTRSSRRLRMDGQQPSISPTDLYTRLGTASAPLVIDVRRAAAFEAADSLIASAFH